MYDGPKCLGMDQYSGNAEIQKAAFDFALNIGYMSFATTAIDGKTPNNRGLEVHRLDDEGNIYVGASRGKHFYDEMERKPYVSALIVDTVAVRINAWLKKVDDEAIRARYWKQNRGTEALYRKDLSNFQVYVMERGEGEIFHVYADDKISRVRFSFGGEPIRPWMYVINDKCNGCGVCSEKCMTSIISIQNGVACKDSYGCNECGICYFSCPHQAVDKREFV